MENEDLLALLEEKIAALKFHISRPQTLAIFILVLVLTLGGVWFYFRNKPKEVSVQTVELEKAKSKKTKNHTKTLFVHVSGAVKNPDVYELREGDRIIDAIKLAGGTTTEADADFLNLAAKVSDGQKIYVPKVGEVPPQQPSFTPGNAGTTDAEQPIVNLDTALQAQLEELPGIGPTLAKRIIDWRTAHNGFTKVTDLNEVSGIGPKKFEDIKDKVSVD